MATTDIDVTTPQGWQAIESRLPEDFERLAKEHKVLEVQYGNAKITTARDLLRLIFLHAGADLGLRQTVSLVAAGGGPPVSHVTLHKKMRLSGPYLKALVAEMVESPAIRAERWGGYDPVVVDGSSFCSPGAEGTDARLHLQLRLTDLEILDVAAGNRSVGESFKRFTWHRGQLALGDRGYANPPGIGVVVEQGADVLVRVNRSALPMFDSRGKPIDLIQWLRGLRGYAAHERPVVVCSREHGCVAEGRLIAMRLHAAEAKKARARLRRELGGHATVVDVEAAEYVVLFTTVPAARMSANICLELYRLRWQIELVFKRWKSICHFDRLPNFRDDTIQSWLYAKILLALLVQRIASGTSLFPPEQDAAAAALALDAVEGRHDHLARPRGRIAAA